MQQNNNNSFKIKSDERLFMCGGTGTGKTYGLLQLIKLIKDSKIIIIDIKLNQAFNDLIESGEFKVINSYKDYKDKDEKIIFRPSNFSEFKELDQTIELLSQEIYKHGHRVVIFDEVLLDETVPIGVLYLLRMGRDRDIGVWIATQKPTYLKNDLIDQAQHFFCFNMLWVKDRAKMESILGNNIDIKIKKLRNHEFIYANPDKKIMQKMIF